jgi:hypothetical protein
LMVILVMPMVWETLASGLGWGNGNAGGPCVNNGRGLVINAATMRQQLTNIARSCFIELLLYE